MPSDFADQPERGELDRAFALVRERWDDERAHGAFFALVEARRAFGEAARLYREAKEGDPSRGPLADKKLAQIALVAMASLDGAHTAPRRGLPAWAKWITAALAALFMAWLARRMMGR